MTRLIKLIDCWKIESKDEVFTVRTPEEVADILLYKGIRDEEIDACLINIFANNHKKAHFGINGTFMYSEK